MKVLVTGGYGFIGSYVAERLFKEGHQIFILDNLSTGNQENVKIKHKALICSTADNKAEELFRHHQIDIVIHLASTNQPDDLDVKQDSEDQLLGLIHMLTLSVKYNVKKFIYASSTAVYGPQDRCAIKEEFASNPLTPHAFHQLMGETYCLKWSQLYGIDVICLRMSNVYGFRRQAKGYGGVIHNWFQQLFDGQELILHGEGNQVRDFIYVEDVVDAIYRTLESGYSGILNISSNQETELLTLLQHFKKIDENLKYIHKPEKPKELPYSRFDHRKAIKILDWAPIYSLEQGLAKTCHLYKKENAVNQKEIAKEKKRIKIPLVKKMVPYIENFLAFGLTAFFTLLPQDFGFVLLDYKILYIMLMGILYGSKHAILAVVLSWALYMVDYIAKGMDLVALFYDMENLARMVVYLFIGLVVGYRIDKKDLKLADQTLELEAIEEKYEFLQQIYQDTRTVKEELQNQLLNSEDSLGKIYSITKELDRLEPEQIYMSAIQLLENIMKSKDISIYTLSENKSYMRLAAKSRMAVGTRASSWKVSEDALLQNIMQAKKVFVNKDFVNDYPLLIAPVVDSNEVIALVIIEKVEFEYFNLYYQNLLQVVINLISAALSRAYRYLNASKHERFLEGTQLLKTEAFEEIIKSKQEIKRQQNIEFILLEIESLTAEDGDWEGFSSLFSGVLRDKDYVGMGREGMFYVLLSNTGETGAKIVQERLIKKGILTRIVQEESLYA